VSDNSSVQEPSAVKAVLAWNPPAADQGLTPSSLINAATGAVKYTLGTWSLATWSRANGALRAGFAGQSYTCKTCAASGDSVNASLGTWNLATWTTTALN
jgi:hypothetical protein